MVDVRGFVVAAWEAGSRVYLAGRLEDGHSFACMAKRGEASILVAERDVGEVSRAFGLRCADDEGDESQAEGPGRVVPGASSCGLELDEKAWSDMEGRPLARFFLPQAMLGRAERIIKGARVSPVSVERGSAEDFLTRRAIKGGVAIRGEARPGRRVDLVFVEPDLVPAELLPPLRWLALDLETDRDERIVAVSLVSRAPAPGSGGRAGADVAEVLFVGPGTGDPRIDSFPDEASLLAALSDRVTAADPDVITGWNILDFDWRVLATRYAALGLPFAFGRSDEAAEYLDRGNRRFLALCPGRAVIDSLRLLRGSGERFDDMRLETVAQALLGEGKSVSAEGEDKLAELDRLRAEDPVAFCSYCLRDSELVIRILETTGLHTLTEARAALTGLPLDLAWTSIPAFERVYAAALRERRVAVPPRENRRVSGAAGGTVLEPLAGFFDDVLVFDFRSLYPSLMRTFNIDPLAHARAGAREPGPGDVVAPNGARFDREPGVLPATIARYAAEREAALARGDETAAYVYKILQNSFYGVLGAEGCRYARTELAGAVTSFGRKFLVFARDFLEAEGFRTLYGDTDSVFVESGLGGGTGEGTATRYATLSGLGERLAKALNAEIEALVRREYGLESFLRIRCDKVYRRFFIPRLRTDTARVESPRLDGEDGESWRRPAGVAILARDGIASGGAPGGAMGAVIETELARGRAKGYAGLRLDADGTSAVEVKGMEAARSDWTPLARRFQVELLELAFTSPEAAAVEAFCKARAAALRSGKLDGELVYRKMLRRAPEEYASSSPQVRAALLLGQEGRRGSVSFVMTKAGAEPASRRSGSQVDYEHYIGHQLLPIAVAVADGLAREERMRLARAAAGGGGGEGPSSQASAWDAERWLSDRPQMELGF